MIAESVWSRTNFRIYNLYIAIDTRELSRFIVRFVTYRIAGKNIGGLPPNCVFADLNLAVWNSIAIHTCTRYKFWRILIWRFRLKPPNRQI